MQHSFETGNIVLRRAPGTPRERREKGRIIRVHARGLTVQWTHAREYVEFHEVVHEDRLERDSYLPPVLAGVR